MVHHDSYQSNDPDSFRTILRTLNIRVGCRIAVESCPFVAYLLGARNPIFSQSAMGLVHEVGGLVTNSTGEK